MNEATPTKRPLKKGDPCWIRIQRDGKPVLGVYEGASWAKTGWGLCFYIDYRMWPEFPNPEPDDAILVAKPIPPNWREIMEAQ